MSVRVKGRFIIQSEIEHSNLDGVGSYSHAQIDQHLVSTSNPHNVTAAQVGNTSALWNANKLQGSAVSSTAPAVGQILVWNGTAWVPSIVSSPIEIPLNRFGDSFFTGSSGYTSASQFVFRGTTALGTPGSVRFIAWGDSGATFAIRLVDILNNTTIGEVTGLTNTTPQVHTLTSLSNLPAGETIFEAQLKLASGSGGVYAYMSFVGVYF